MLPAPGGGVRLTGLAGLSEFVANAHPEFAANAMVCAVNQAPYLLRRQLESQGRAFLEQGGFTERLYTARNKARGAKACPTSQTGLTCPTNKNR